MYADHFTACMLTNIPLYYTYQDVEESDNDARDEREHERHGEPRGVGVGGRRHAQHFLHQDQQRLRERAAESQPS